MPRKKYIPSEKDFRTYYELSRRHDTTYGDIAMALGIGRATLFKWKKDFDKRARKLSKEYREPAREVKKREFLRRQPGGPVGSRILTPSMRDKILTVAATGLTDTEIADICHVNKFTVYSWRRKDPRFDREYRNAKKITDYKVVDALRRRAQGYKVKDTIETTVYDRNNVVVSKTKVDRFKELPPNVQAATLWLVNRMNWSKDSEKTRADNKGAILEALEEMSQLSQEDIANFDKKQEQFNEEHL